MREEIIQNIVNRDGKEIGVITRNAYGSLVLNAANARFIDIDFEQDGLLGSLMAKIRGLYKKETPTQ